MFPSVYACALRCFFPSSVASANAAVRFGQPLRRTIEGAPVCTETLRDVVVVAGGRHRSAPNGFSRTRQFQSG